MGPEHWSRARKDSNQEALEYYRERSHAPGVEAGGGPRNFYCMRCDGVIPEVPPLPVYACKVEGDTIMVDIEQQLNDAPIPHKPYH